MVMAMAMVKAMEKVVKATDCPTVLMTIRVGVANILMKNNAMHCEM